MNPKISVIIPIFNVERYLCKCINSIINQTYSNLEIILVDDGSPDNCGLICDNYSLKDDRIKVIHKENGGLSDARNIGLDKATGDYVSFIDSDDYINKEFYLTLVNLVIKYNADIVQCEFLKVYENYSNKYDPKSYNDENITILSNKEALNNLFNENYVNTVVVWNKIYRRKLFRNIRYPKGKIHEDEYTTYKLLFNAEKVVSTSKKMYYYLQRSNSIMGKGFNVKSLDKLEAYHQQVIFYNNKNLFELANMARFKFENIIRVSISMIWISRLDNKNQLFNDLIDFYRKNYNLFKNNSNASFKKKVIMLMFRYSSKFVIKILCNLMNLKA